MMSIEKIQARSVVHTQAIATLSLSRDGRKIADAMCVGVARMIGDAVKIRDGRGENAALDAFYAGLVSVYRDAGWGRIGLRDKLAIVRTASLDDMSNARALVASVKIARL